MLFHGKDNRTNIIFCINDSNPRCDVCLFVCIGALRPKSTAMVIAGRSVHLTTLISWASLNKQLKPVIVHILSLVTDNNPS